jgi:hypothetical protein
MKPKSQKSKLWIALHAAPGIIVTMYPVQFKLQMIASEKSTWTQSSLSQQQPEHRCKEVERSRSESSQEYLGSQQAGRDQ